MRPTALPHKTLVWSHPNKRNNVDGGVNSMRETEEVNGRSEDDTARTSDTKKKDGVLSLPVEYFKWVQASQFLLRASYLF